MPVCTHDNLVVEKTISVAAHPDAFEQHNFPPDGFDGLAPSADAYQLIALIILFLHHEKNIQTVEGERVNQRMGLPEFTTQWSSRPHGGDDAMFQALNYKEFSITHMLNHTASRATLSKQIEDMEHIQPKPKSDSQFKLIEEVRTQPHWQINHNQKQGQTYEYTIRLPRGTKVEDCLLDISRVRCL